MFPQTSEGVTELVSTNATVEYEPAGLLMGLVTAAPAESPRSKPPVMVKVVSRIRNESIFIVLASYELIVPLASHSPKFSRCSAAARGTAPEEISTSAAFKIASEIVRRCLKFRVHRSDNALLEKTASLH
jgi:hypothetical protein